MIVSAAIACAALGCAYVGRRVIAERLAANWLAERRVPGDVHIEALSLTGLTAAVRIGRAEDPDLTIARLDIAYQLAGPWDGRAFAVETRSVRLIGPHLKARLVHGALDLGALAPLLRALSRQPSVPGATPDLDVRDGWLQLSTPAGALTLRGEGALRGGIVSRLDARTEPFVLKLGDGRLSVAGARVQLERRGGRLAARARAGALALSTPKGAWRAAGGEMRAELPAPARNGQLAGPAHITLQLAGLDDAQRSLPGGATTLDAELAGRLAASASALAFAGAAQARLQTASISTAAGPQVTAQVRLAHARLRRDAIGLLFEGDGQASMAATSVKLGGLAIQAAAARLAIDRAHYGSDGFLITLRGAASGRGGLDQATAGRLAGAQGVAARQDYRPALARALESFRLAAPGFRTTISGTHAALALPAPLTFASASGARLAITGDAESDFTAGHGAAMRVTLDGGGLPKLDARLAQWSLGPQGLAANLALAADLDLPFARGLSLKGSGRIAVDGRRARLVQTGCADVGAKRILLGSSEIEDAALALCPSDGPLLDAGPGGWRVAGRAQAARGLAAGLATALSDGEGEFLATGSGAGLRKAEAEVNHGRLTDTSGSGRFRPLGAAGKLRFADDAWTGNFTVATDAGRPIAEVRLRQDGATGAGRADIDARSATFAPGGLQPAQITPLAGAIKDAAGPAGFSGWFAWAPDAPLRSGGEFVTHDLRLRSPAGEIVGIDADLKFASLAPLTTVADQKIAVREIQQAMPITSLRATFGVDADAMSIEAAHADFAGGEVRLEPMRVPFAANASYRGVLAFDHVDLGQVVAATNLSHAVTVDAVVDGRIPFDIGPAGVRILDGHLAAVRPGRLSIARTVLGAAPAVTTAKTSNAPAQAPTPGFASDMAYQAMENLAFDKMDASLDSLANGRLRVLFHIKGQHAPPQPVRARITVTDLLRGQALSKPLPLPSGTKINLTLDSTLNFDDLVRSLEDAWRGGLHSAKVQGPAGPITATEVK